MDVLLKQADAAHGHAVFLQGPEPAVHFLGALAGFNEYLGAHHGNAAPGLGRENGG